MGGKHGSGQDGLFEGSVEAQMGSVRCSANAQPLVGAGTARQDVPSEEHQRQTPGAGGGTHDGRAVAMGTR